jgi:tetratricopeptide (TPR) repeat protein/DNA-binding CsgD family transcriptional regulator
MENNIHHNPYDEKVPTINGISFTHREIDIITAIIHMRGAGKIASLLSISTRTVETHTANIMRKMDINSRERIIDFIEKAGHLPWINKHYNNLLIQTEFKKLSKAVIRLTHNKSLSCYIIYEPDKGISDFYLAALKKHLNACDIKTILFETTNEKSIGSSLLQETFPLSSHIIYVIPDRFSDLVPNQKDKYTKEISSLTQRILSKHSSLTYLLFNKDIDDIPQKLVDLGYVGIRDEQEFFSLLFKVLTRIVPDIKLDEIASQLLKNFDVTSKQPEMMPPSPDLAPPSPQQQDSILRRRRFTKMIWSLVMITSLCLSLFIFKQQKWNTINAQDPKSAPSIRSDLIVPTGNTFLNRPTIIAKLEESLKGSEGIQAVALVGIGGAGKTTIARRYALQQNSNIVWEVNATTLETLKDSFERLAYALCKTEEEKKILSGLQNIKNNVERDEKILLFVKEKLKNVSNWFLIFDNVEKFADIQKYFPCDSTVWGNGKLIVTTSDSNTKNNSLIHKFIQIGELSPQDKLSLFINIMMNENPSQLNDEERLEAKNFLMDVPPFPLDVAIAAYYLKSTHTPYSKYLESVKENSQEFDTIQTNVVKEASDYTKTRYRIITLSLKHLIETHKDFGDLLLLISLLNSQNIPRALLSQYKSDVVVDNFIYNLKKYSLLTNESSSNLIPTIFIHRRTQEISLDYFIKTLNLSMNSPQLESIASTLEDYVVDAIDKEDFFRLKLLVPHCETFLTHKDVLSEPIKSSIGGALGSTYYYLRYNNKAKNLLEENLKNLTQYYGENHIKIAHILVYLGNFYRSVGHYEKAKSLLEQSIEIYKKHPNYTRKAKALGYLGVVYRDLGDYQKAKNYLEQSLDLHQKYSRNQIGHAWALAHLGILYVAIGDYKKTELLLEQSLSIYKKHSEDYIGVAWALGVLGSVSTSLGDYDKALKLLEQSILITRKHFSDDHFFIAEKFSYLATLYIEMGQYQKARSLLKDCLAVFEKNLGANHMDTARILRILGEAHYGDGDFEASEEFLNKSLLMFQQNNNPEHYKSQESLGTLYMKKASLAANQGETKQAQIFHDKATQYLGQALEMAMKLFPQESAHVKNIQTKLSQLEGRA